MATRRQSQGYQGVVTRKRARLQSGEFNNASTALTNKRVNTVQGAKNKESKDHSTPPRKRKKFNNALITPESNKHTIPIRTLSSIPEDWQDDIVIEASNAVGPSYRHPVVNPTPAASEQPAFTPFKINTQNAQNITTRGYSTTELQSTRRLEARAWVNDYISHDITGLLELAAPDNKTAEATAGRLAEDLSTLVEDLLLVKSSKVVNSGRRDRGGKNAKKGPSKESDLYEPISQLFHFVAGCIKSVGKPLKAHPERLILPLSTPDRKNADGDDASRADLVLNIVDMNEYSIGTSTRAQKCEKDISPMLFDAFALIEVKTGAHGVKRALPQLFQYTRGIYAEQYNRRFAWGLAVGGKQIQAVFFGSSYALASPSMDISQKSGREQLIRLLVDWSFCESHKLGYDPTILFNKQSRYYEIQVGHGNKMTTYYSQGAVIGVERLFGRHTRCFVASKTRPRAGVEFKPELFIKDAWPEATSDAEEDHRDESRHLNKITAVLGDDKSLDGKYPRYIDGCRVHIKRRITGQKTDMVEDNSRSILSDSICTQLNSALKERAPPLRVHKRICMDGIGKPLKHINSVPELICVMADAMECHWEIYKRCGILHRDISTNNILFTGSGSSIKGMLIDFDHAFCENDKSDVHRFERTGTLPFMSVNNLEGKVKKHTVLDDWESLLYILCWLGTYGWRNKSKVCGVGPEIPQGRLSARADNSKTNASRQTTRTRYLKGHPRAEPGFKEISRWFTGELSACALNKRRDLKDYESFKLITDQFDKDIASIGILQMLVRKIRKTLIDEHGDRNMRGAIKKSEESEEQDEQFDLLAGPKDETRMIDPFVERIQDADGISERLLDIMRIGATQVRTLLRDNESKDSH
ncbi:hypothetical protein IWW48_003447 [Coemansia sp. RSA 1200]|nr:hypothetical protein IWW48_003447 [Coemansia sp. RSA 1200]